jgi:hypothetical protein
MSSDGAPRAKEIVSRMARRIRRSAWIQGQPSAHIEKAAVSSALRPSTS